jgi:hypothetical protein
VGFKSYAHLFYTCKACPEGDKALDDYANLAFGAPGKDVCFVAKITHLGDLPNLPGCKEVARKNGFVFFEKPLSLAK